MNHKIHKAYKTELKPSRCQQVLFQKACGTARFAYNWGLQRKIEEYANTKKTPSAMDLNKELVLLKNMTKDEGGVPWMYEVPKDAPQYALRNLDDAFKRFFKNCKDSKSGKKGFPKFKKKSDDSGTFKVQCAKTFDSYIHIPKIGKVKLKEKGYIPTDVKILSATVSQRAGKWFVSVSVEQNNYYPQTTSDHVIGVDVGIKTLAVTSDGEVFDNPKSYSKKQKQLGRYQKSLSKKEKGSSNRKKAKLKVSKLHYKIACIRKEALHKTSKTIAKSAGVVVIEDLNVKGMMKNRHLSKSLGDASLSELHRQIEYKSNWRGVKVVKANRWFASSKTCSNCNHVMDKMTLNVRTWICPNCNVKHDRDVNAAINLKNIIKTHTVGSTEFQACGEVSSGGVRKNNAKLTSTKQEPLPY